METFQLCKRKWWLEKVRKLDPGGSTHAQAFGTVLHAVCERYLEADDLGRDANGNPVELYPEGWHIARNRYGGVDGEITPAEQDLIKRLISKSVEEGILERRLGRRIEHSFRVPVLTTDDGVKISVEGFVDVLYDDVVEDHKTSKSTRYLKTPDTLRKNTQVLIYAYVALAELRKSNKPLPKTITVRHNQFVKDPKRPIVRKTEVSLTVEEIEEFWEQEVKKTAKDMAKLRASADTWSDVPDPSSLQAACNAYGGCPFRPICSGSMSEAGYEKRFDNQGKGAYLTVSAQKGDTQGAKKMAMDLRAKLAAKQQAKQEAESSEPKKPANNIQPKAEAEAKPETPSVDLSDLGTAEDGTQLTVPPWVDPKNPVSKVNDGLGFNPDGAPCKISDLKAKASKRPTSDMFIIEPLGDGTVIWVGKDGTAAEGLEGRSPLSLTPQASVEAQERSAPAQTPAKAKEPEKEPEAPQEANESEEESQAVKNGKKGGRPPKSFILVIDAAELPGSTQRKGSGRYGYNLHDEFEAICQEMASQNEVESFYELDVWKRRDALAKCAPALAESFKQDIVFAIGVGTGMSDFKALVDALIPHAGMVIKGTA